MVDAVLDIAWRIAQQRSSSEDLANGIIAALRRRGCHARLEAARTAA
jgi:hypothetical protein